MAATLKLVCPIRGELNAPAKSSDGLKPSEEARRVEVINFLLEKGYPKENIKVEATIKRFGNAGRNSFRCDVAALDVAIDRLNSSDPDELLEHAVLLGEVKRDHKTAASAKATQVEPMLDFAHSQECVALYWDDTEQRIYWRETQSGRRVSHSAPAMTLPSYGNRIGVKPLTFNDITPTESLLYVFERVEDILHAAAIDPEARYGVILQLLLAKLYDEHSHEGKPEKPLALQDYRALGTAPGPAIRAVNASLSKAVAYYGMYLSKPVGKRLPITQDTLFEVLEVLAPVKIIASRQEVVQTFYMHFAKHLYKWDLAQFFTPVTISDFIARALAPGFGEHIKDPACGSADFLTSAYRLGAAVDPNYADCIWGADNSANAVQVAVLNMLLNGDGKSKIAEEDSLVNVDKQKNRFEMVICNPPFGTRINESRREVLSKFDLGHEWKFDADGIPQQTPDTRQKQQVGILFAELCVQQARPGGRIAIILPNGYLGNRGLAYRALREWLLRHCRIAAICAFPRFTFKTSGADVSASVLFLEKRKVPVRQATLNAGYRFYVGMVESVGWQLGDKGAKPVYLQDPEDGSFIADAHGNRMLYADFDRILGEMRASDASKRFPWMARGVKRGSNGWSVDARDVVKDPTLCLDPKRLSEKAVRLRASIAAIPHLRLGDICEFLPQVSGGWDSRGSYRYVELADITQGAYRWENLRGWELPERARHLAEPGDVFIGSVWGSVQKWMLAGGDTNGLIVTNGCLRLRIRKGKGKYLLDLVAALATEAYATQMRSIARGSDGLAEVGVDDAAGILVPRINNRRLREELEPFVDQLLAGHTSVRAKVDHLLDSGALRTPVPSKRPSHSVLV